MRSIVPRRKRKSKEAVPRSDDPLDVDHPAPQKFKSLIQSHLSGVHNKESLIYHYDIYLRILAAGSIHRPILYSEVIVYNFRFPADSPAYSVRTGRPVRHACLEDCDIQPSPPIVHSNRSVLPLSGSFLQHIFAEPIGQTHQLSIFSAWADAVRYRSLQHCMNTVFKSRRVR